MRKSFLFATASIFCLSHAGLTLQNFVLAKDIRKEEVTKEVSDISLTSPDTQRTRKASTEIPVAAAAHDHSASLQFITYQPPKLHVVEPHRLKETHTHVVKHHENLGMQVQAMQDHLKAEIPDSHAGTHTAFQRLAAAYHETASKLRQHKTRGTVLNHTEAHQHLASVEVMKQQLKNIPDEHGGAHKVGLTQSVVDLEASLRGHAAAHIRALQMAQKSKENLKTTHTHVVKHHENLGMQVQAMQDHLKAEIPDSHTGTHTAFQKLADSYHETASKLQQHKTRGTVLSHEEARQHLASVEVMKQQLKNIPDEHGGTHKVGLTQSVVDLETSLRVHAVVAQPHEEHHAPVLQAHETHAPPITHKGHN